MSCRKGEQPGHREHSLEVHVDALQLQVGVAVVRSGGVNAVLIRANLWTHAA